MDIKKSFLLFCFRFACSPLRYLLRWMPPRSHTARKFPNMVQYVRIHVTRRKLFWLHGKLPLSFRFRGFSAVLMPSWGLLVNWGHHDRHLRCLGGPAVVSLWSITKKVPCINGNPENWEGTWTQNAHQKLKLGRAKTLIRLTVLLCLFWTSTIVWFNVNLTRTVWDENHAHWKSCLGDCTWKLYQPREEVIMLNHNHRLKVMGVFYGHICTLLGQRISIAIYTTQHQCTNTFENNHFGCSVTRK